MNLRIVTADRVPWEDLDAVFVPGNPHGSNWASNNCRCQRVKVMGRMWRDSALAERLAAQRAQARGGSGLVAFVDDEPAGWVAVEPRVAYPKLLALRAPWTGRNEDRHDPDVWAITCFVVRKSYRATSLVEMRLPPHVRRGHDRCSQPHRCAPLASLRCGSAATPASGRPARSATSFAEIGSRNS